MLGARTEPHGDEFVGRLRVEPHDDPTRAGVPHRDRGASVRHMRRYSMPSTSGQSTRARCSSDSYDCDVMRSDAWLRMRRQWHGKCLLLRCRYMPSPNKPLQRSGVDKVLGRGRGGAVHEASPARPRAEASVAGR